MTYALFVAGFILLIKGADLLVDGASAIAKRLNVSDLVIGLTVVAFGTSLPELFVNIFAGIHGNTDIAVGNVLGSNIANILLILGVASVIHPLSIKSVTVWKEIPFSLLAAILVAILANDRLIDGKDFAELSRIDGMVLISFFVIFMYYVFESMRKSPDREDEAAKQMSIFKSVVFILLGIAGLIFGGNWIVEGAVAFAKKYDVSENLIGLTIVAVGTSLPELATSAIAAYKKNADIAIGNVVGSNIFNIFFVLGISSTIHPLPFQPSCNTDIAMTLFSSVLLFAFLFIGKRHLLERWQGILFLLLYAAYTGYLIYRG
jgi:cation:H+ antiporter